MDVCLGRSKALDRTPVAYLTCNGSPPVGDTPSLMTFREVTQSHMSLRLILILWESGHLGETGTRNAKGGALRTLYVRKFVAAKTVSGAAVRGSLSGDRHKP